MLPRRMAAVMIVLFAAPVFSLTVGATVPATNAARLTIVQVTDVCKSQPAARDASSPFRRCCTSPLAVRSDTLNNFPHLKSLLEEVRATNPHTISVLTGDFLAPYLLSSIDKGHGMMSMINETPIDYLTWGNHEADIDHKEVCRHVRGYSGKWLNSNMLDHEAMDAQVEHDIVEVTSPDGAHVRRVGLCAVLSDDPALYANFKAPGAFGGATIDCPWDTLRKCKERLEGDERCDVVVPLQHLYERRPRSNHLHRLRSASTRCARRLASSQVPDDHRTCREFNFPVVLSGHDHHRVDEVVEGTRLLKPGLDGIYATVLTLEWADKEQSTPTVSAEFVRVPDWPADAQMAEAAERAYDALAPLRSTELAQVPPPIRTPTPNPTHAHKTRMVCRFGGPTSFVSRCRS
jgi:2',3'-cyclic-nucleotide 2'-phosphodiesterase (5'-nucleotidase family)